MARKAKGSHIADRVQDAIRAKRSTIHFKPLEIPAKPRGWSQEDAAKFMNMVDKMEYAHECY